MDLKNTTKVLAAKTGFVLKKHAPSIMTYAGTAGFVATVALTIRATTKMDEVAPKLRSQVEEVKTEIAENAETIDKKEASKKLAEVYINVAKEAAIIYAPVFVTGTASILLVLGGHGMMTKRQAQLAAIYATLDASYKAYRARIREELGEEKELEIYRRPVMRALDQDETGEGSNTVMIDSDGVNASPYTAYFDETNPNWVKEAEWNKMFLKAQEKYFNDRLRAHGFVFLNEVLEGLGCMRTQAGQIVGWKLDRDGTARPGTDGFISFGIERLYDELARAFVNGLENVVMLDFNVDGPITI